MALQSLKIDMTGRGGLAPKWGGDTFQTGTVGYDNELDGEFNLRYQAAANQAVSGAYNPSKRYGFLSPSSRTFNTLRTLTDHVPCSLVDDETQIQYFVDDDDNITFGGYDGTDFSVVNWDDSDVTRYTDMCMYYLDGVRTIYVIGSNDPAFGGDSNIITFTPGDPATHDSSFMDEIVNAFNLYGSYSNKLIPSGDGFLYVLNRNSLHRIDGTTIGGSTATIYQDILQAPDDTFLTHGCEYNNYLYVIVQKNKFWSNNINEQDPFDISSGVGNVGVYVWNRQSAFYNSSNFINIPGINHVRKIWVTPKNDLCLIAITATGETQLMKFNGSKFITDQQLPFGAYPIAEHALKVYGNYSYWCASDGVIYVYGSEFASEQDGLFIMTSYSDSQGVRGVGASQTVSINIVGSASSNLTWVDNYKQTKDIIYIAGEVTDSNFIIQQYFMAPLNQLTLSS